MINNTIEVKVINGKEFVCNDALVKYQLSDLLKIKYTRHIVELETIKEIEEVLFLNEIKTTLELTAIRNSVVNIFTDLYEANPDYINYWTAMSSITSIIDAHIIKIERA